MIHDTDQEQNRRPVLMITVGRQRAGETVFLNTLSQYSKEHVLDVMS